MMMLAIILDVLIASDVDIEIILVAAVNATYAPPWLQSSSIVMTCHPLPAIDATSAFP